MDFGGDINVVDNAPPSISATEWWEEAGAAQISSSLQHTMKAFVSHDNNIKNCYHFPLPKKHIPMLALLILRICYRVLALYNCWFFVFKFNFSLLIEDFLTSSRTSFGFFSGKRKELKKLWQFSRKIRHSLSRYIYCLTFTNTPVRKH